MKEFTVSANFNASANDLYAAWLDSNQHAAMTGSGAEVSSDVGASFSAWDGYISGKNLELDENKRILQAWRTVEFKDVEADSHIEITFEEIEVGNTLLTLRHYDLPDHGDQYESGWEESYFKPMRAYFK